jgi:hypothetical protein
MSQKFRPVKENWNTHSSCFIEPDQLTTLVRDLAARVGTASDEHEYGDTKAVWFEHGAKVLEYIEADGRFNADDSLEEQVVTVNKDDLSNLLVNMRSLARQRRTTIGEHGELVFYIDA